MNQRRSNLTASVVIHVVVFALFWALTALFPGHEPEQAPIDVVFYKPPAREPAPPPPVEFEPEPEPEPVPERPKPPPPEPEVKIAEVEPPPPPKPVIKPKPVEVPEIAQVQPKMEARPKRQVITTPALQQEAKPERPKRPRREVKTALLNAAATKPATRLDDRPKKKASTGAFANTDKNDPNPPSRNLRGGTPKVGGFQVAEHTAPAAQKPSRTVSRSSGFGNSDPDAQPGHSRGNGNTGTVATGGFGSTAKAERPRSERKVVSEKPDTPVEILSKPTPEYTGEARELRVEGEVSLRVTFLASGEVKVLEVIHGLGHGLDEAAMKAAKRIRFKPARRERQPVDHTTVLRIVFQLV